jgi:hypothetical protein
MLLARRFDRENGRFVGDLPEDWPEPRVLVSDRVKAGQSSSSSLSRPRPRLLEVAQTIEAGLSRASRVEVVAVRRPRSLELDPAFGLSSTSSRLDRLIRTIVADPRSLDPKLIEVMALRASRLQDPVSPRSLIDLAVERWSEWVRSSEAREIARSSPVRRAFEWMVAWPESGRSTIFQGRADFLFRLSGDANGLACLSDPRASEDRERLRVMLSAVAAERMGLGQIREVWSIRLGSKTGPIVIDRFDRASIDQAVERVMVS